MAYGDRNGQVRSREDCAKEVASTLAKYRGQIEQSIPSKAAEMVKPERAVRLVMTEARRIPKLLECTSQSIVGAMLTAAALGLDIGAHLGHAYVLPFKQTATFVIGYKGMIALAYRSTQIASLAAYVVRPRDKFTVELGSDPKIVHVPELRDQTDAIAYYAVARTIGGGAVFDRPLTVADVLKYKARSPSAKKPGGPWETDFEAMAKKTAVRRLGNYLPTSPELAYAVQADGIFEEGGKRPPPPPELDWLLDGFGSEGEALEDGAASGGALPSGDVEAPVVGEAPVVEEAKKR